MTNMEKLEMFLGVLERDGVIYDYEVLDDNVVNIMDEITKNEKDFLRVYTFSFENSKASVEIEDLERED